MGFWASVSPSAQGGGENPPWPRRYRGEGARGLALALLGAFVSFLVLGGTQGCSTTELHPRPFLVLILRRGLAEPPGHPGTRDPPASALGEPGQFPIILGLPVGPGKRSVLGDLGGRRGPARPRPGSSLWEALSGSRRPGMGPGHVVSDTTKGRRGLGSGTTRQVHVPESPLRTGCEILVFLTCKMGTMTMNEGHRGRGPGLS